jgi:hypothetical protein
MAPPFLLKAGESKRHQAIIVVSVFKKLMKKSYNVVEDENVTTLKGKTRENL